MSTQIVQRFARSPSLVAHAFGPDIAALAGAPERNAERTDAAQQMAVSYGYENEKGKPFPFAAGVAVIPVYGALLHRDRWCDSYATGYDYIESRFSAALGDPDVKGILFDINSYGGHVAGNFELCDRIFAARGTKPMMAMVDSRSLSGGYSIASAVGRIVATPSSDIGSIGVVLMHMSYAEMLKNLGVEVTYIFAGKHKVDGNPFEKLPEDVKAALQASVEKSYEKFVALVARHRGLDADAVRATEAKVYDAEEAKALGLIDDVMVSSDAFKSFLLEATASAQPSKEKPNMTTQNTQQQAGTGGSDSPVDENTIRQEAAKAATARIESILSCEHAVGCEQLANHIAFKTSMSVEDAVATLAAAPKAAKPAEGAPAVPGALAAAMNATGGGANVGAGGDEEEVTNGPQARGARLLENASQHFGLAKK